MVDIVISVVGWAAAGLILGSYVLLSLGKMTGQDRVYQWMNVVGAVGFAVNSGYHGAMPSAALNVVWAAMGIFTLWRIAKLARAAHQAR